MKKIVKIILISIITLQVSCNKNDDDYIEPSQKLISYTENGVELNFTYENQKPIAFESYNNSAPGNKISEEITYNSAGNILSIGTGNYSYNSSGKINSSTLFGRNTTIQYDSQNRVIRTTGSGTISTNTYSFQRDYIYTGTRVTRIIEIITSTFYSGYIQYDIDYNSQGNISQIETYEGPNQTNLSFYERNTFTYDNMKNPWYKFYIEEMGNPNFFPNCFYDQNKIVFEFGFLSANKIQYISSNNLLSRVRTYSSNTYTTNYTYTYNNYNLPLSLEKTISGTTQYFSFTYN